MGRTLDANRLLAGSACGKRQRGRPLNSVVRHRSAVNNQLRHFLHLAMWLAPGFAFPYCERHPMLEEELRGSDTVMVGRVLSDRETPSPLRDKSSRRILDPGHTYTLAVTEVFRGKTRKKIDLFTEYNSGQFPMDIGKSYLVILPKGERVLSVDSCGNSGEVGEKAKELELIRDMFKRRRNDA